MWKLEREEDYFRIFDSKKDIAGYFDPDYGEVFPKDKEQEIIDQMHKNREKIPGGFLMVPMVKFGIFDNEKELNIDSLGELISNTKFRLEQWRQFLNQTQNKFHSIRVSHTDSDMLSITFPLKFDNPCELEKSKLLEKIDPILNLLQKQGLL